MRGHTKRDPTPAPKLGLNPLLRPHLYQSWNFNVCQSWNFKNHRKNLSEDVNVIHDYFNKCYLKINKTKTVSTIFHLENHHANQVLKIPIGNKQLPPEPRPKYLGVTLNRTLTYEKYIKKVAQKLKTRNPILKKLIGTNWGAHHTILSTSALVFCYSTAEYCAPVWERRKHTKKIGTQLTTIMKILPETLKSTLTVWLPTMATIAPPISEGRISLKTLTYNWKTYRTTSQSRKQLKLHQIQLD